eukprot:TRINITY_DN3841_c0_g1_i1.p1 TRINITY_DN3841_c0_g1~~TRINITY_DN3841_c0_g1_i1.p1  ORF type:complete len:488 (+),score=136.50 TRINITY_DN3841_c0_g1_i1:89-1552(+)
MASQFDSLRALHEDAEVLEHFIVETTMLEPKTHKDTIIQQHLIASALNQCTATKKKILDIYKDDDKSLKADTDSLSGEGPVLYGMFYDRLRDIKDYHRQFPNVEVNRHEDILPTEETIDLTFTGEESYGKYLDLHEFHSRFLNLTRNRARAARLQKKGYVGYLATFYQFDNDDSTKKTDYKTYITELLEYLCGFLRKAQPLFDLDKVLESDELSTAKDWASGAFVNWPQASVDDEDDKATGNDDEAKPDEDPLYCKFCQRKFSKDTVFAGHLNGKKHTRAEERYRRMHDSTSRALDKELFFAEVSINKLATQLGEYLKNTRNRVQQKQARTLDEIMEDIEQGSDDEAEDLSDDEDDEDQQKLGIKDYPTGWDGKPIPYWLYKLHGLDKEFTCEICGNQSYMGPRTFEKHFQEWRHAHGMRCLGIPNTREFHMVTNIKDAQELHEKLKANKDKDKWVPEQAMEFEDANGNVMNRKTYNDLKRQGLLRD